MQHGSDLMGNTVTITAFSHYNYNGIIASGLSELWLQLALYCDVYFDLMLHARTEATGRMVCRHDVVDISDVGLSSVSKPMLSLLGRMGESAQHYPEMICRTTCVNFGSVGILLLRLVKPFLPKQTRDKFVPCGSTYTIEGTPVERLPKRFNGSCKCRWCRLNTDRLPLPITIPSASTAVLAQREIICQRAGAKIYWQICESGSYNPASGSAAGGHNNDKSANVDVVATFRPAETADELLFQAPNPPNSCPWSPVSAFLPATPPTTTRKRGGSMREEQRTVISSPPPPNFVAPSCGVLVLSLTCAASWSSWTGTKKAHLAVEVHYDGDGIGN
jgi:hypothetical protein